MRTYATLLQIVVGCTLLPPGLHAEGIDTEHLFGFTIGSDVGEAGEREFQNQATGRFGKSGGSYRALTNSAELEFVPIKNFRLEFSALAASYNVGGVAVNKNIQRQTLTPIALTGTYSGGIAVNDSGCTSPSDNGPVSLPATITVTQPASGPLQMTFDFLGVGTCTLVSTSAVSQTGALHAFSASLACPGDPPWQGDPPRLAYPDPGFPSRSRT